MKDADRNEAVLHMVQSGAFPDDFALVRWSVTPEAVPILQRWLEEGRAPLPRSAAEIDHDAVGRELAEQDALAADIQARFGPAAGNRSDAQTVTDMFAVGWFDQGAAFWRWVETPAAKPYIAACAAMRRAPEPGELFDAYGRDDDAMSVIDDVDALAQLAARIEAEHGDGSVPNQG
ncbi:hypothetical protein [Sphingomonas bacterium]|uniref:hypothetical protein n=1 Tax=Sphingomonas bacterium TaxID=1895847 RepID=UPI0020C72049|nr:hypothetical protein [Sphingomonas bacterium]